jgi:hypothetical protein
MTLREIKIQGSKGVATVYWNQPNEILVASGRIPQQGSRETNIVTKFGHDDSQLVIASWIGLKIGYQDSDDVEALGVLIGMIKKGMK